MQFLMLFNPDFRPFEPKAVERAFRSCNQFTHFRMDDPHDSLIECQYKEHDDWTTIRLSGDANCISVNNTWGAALRAMLLIQQALGVPLRMVDDVNSFDLTFADISTVEELEAAMENARTS
jgi:hypothetical protein